MASKNVVPLSKASRFSAYDSPLSSLRCTKFVLNGVQFNSLEHYYQYHKALALEQDNDELVKNILLAESPHVARELGKQIKIKDCDWEDSYETMLTGSIAKFKQNRQCNQYLRRTGSKKLAYCDVADNYWGVGMEKNDKDAAWPHKWLGKNLMGHILLKTRDVLVNDLMINAIAKLTKGLKKKKQEKKTIKNHVKMVKKSHDTPPVDN